MWYLFDPQSCQHNTKGELCEQCADGFFGDPTAGTPEDCQACACPGTDPDNQLVLTYPCKPYLTLPAPAFTISASLAERFLIVILCAGSLVPVKVWVTEATSALPVSPATPDSIVNGMLTLPVLLQWNSIRRYYYHYNI